MNFLRGFSFNAACTGLVFGAGLINSVLLPNSLGKENYGRLTLWLTTVTLGALVFGEWLSKGSTYAAGKGGARGRLVGNALTYGLVLVGVLVGVGYLTGTAELPLLPELGPVQLSFLAGLVALMVLQKVAEAILLGENRIKPYSLLPVLFICAYLGGNLLVLKVWGGGLGEVLGVWAVSVGLAGLVGFALLLRGAEVGLDRQLWNQTVQVGRQGAVSVVLIYLLFRSDQYLVGHFLGEGQVGVYRVAGTFAELMQRLPNVAGALLLPRMIRGGEEELSLQVARGVLLFSLICAAGVVLAGKFLLALFLPAYQGAYLPLLWMLPGLVVAGFGSVFNTRLAGQGYPAISLWSPALALALNVALNLVLIPAMGLVGAALSTSLAYGLWGLSVARYCLRQLGCGWGAFLRGKASPPSIEKP